MKKLPLILLLITFQFLQAQKEKSTQMGLATLDEVKLTKYDKDPTAKAVVLYEHANVYLDKENDYKTRTDFYFRIKILDKTAFDLAEVNIDLYKENSVIDIKATTYNLSDIGAKTTTSLASQDIYTTNPSANYTRKKFTLPNIKEGSVIEYSYSILNPYLGIKDWYFQSDIPKIKSEFDAAILGNYNYNIRITGTQKLNKNNASLKKGCIYIEGIGDGECSVYSFGMYDIPAFKEENYMLSKENYISKLSFDLKTYTSPRGVVTKYTTSWKNADKKLKTIFFNNQTSKKKYFRKRLPESILNNQDKYSKAKSIFNFIKNHYTWNKRYWNSNDESVKDAFDDKVGSAGEINISLYNSLNAADIDCNLTILSTRNNGLPTKLYPIIFDFNYVVVQVTIDGKIFYLDATDKFLPFGQLPERCLVPDARVINFKSSSNWVNLKSRIKTAKNSNAKLTLNEDGEISGSLLVRSQGYEAINKRKSISNSDEDSYLESFENSNLNIEVDDYNVKFENELEKPLIENYDVSLDIAEELQNKIRINPFFYDKLETNPFQLKERNYEVDFGYTRKVNFYIKLTIPENYKVISLPENVAIALPNKDASFILNASQKENTITIYTRLSINKEVFRPNEYNSLKQLFNAIIQGQKSYIVLEAK
ncbi:DUF3857 domain-containing protein [Polaribacter sp. MED152]|uniref:DUF3857 domain-containing protein n=1 Tax=Polaribacter sp. MED152 TaxID=313598 RepID=UPI000186F42E|nr:DUF3857 domain-containing protein [Polaribacter sp. MED152]